ncbi:unnamed protein product [Camellia sinensis]
MLRLVEADSSHDNNHTHIPPPPHRDLQDKVISAMAASDSDSRDDRIARIASAIRVIPDCPKPGIMFQDITTLLLDPKAGFIFGPPIALAIGAKFVPMRKPKRWPGEVISEEYSLEYGTDKMEMHVGAVQAGERGVGPDFRLGWPEYDPRVRRREGGERRRRSDLSRRRRADGADVVGGSGHRGAEGIVSYDMDTGIWKQFAIPAPLHVSDQTLAECGGRIMLVGLLTKNAATCVCIWELQKMTLLWKEVDSLYKAASGPRSAAVAATIGGVVVNGWLGFCAKKHHQRINLSGRLLRLLPERPNIHTLEKERERPCPREGLEQ